MILLKFYGALNTVHYGDIPRPGDQIVGVMQVLTVTRSCVIVDGPDCWCEVEVY